MKIKLDENLPTSLRRDLENLGHDVDTALDEGLKGRPDCEVHTRAVADGRFLITQDLDFSDVRRFKPQTHEGIMLLRLDEPDWRALTSRVMAVFRTNAVETWRGCLVIVTDSKIRVRAD